MSSNFDKEGRLESVPVALIRPLPNALRTNDPEDPKYLELVANIQARGLLHPIGLSEKQVDKDTGEEYYWLQDGLQRFSAVKSLGKETIQAIIRDDSVESIIKNQISANKHKIETRPVEYTKACVALLELDQTLTLDQLAADMGVSLEWLKGRIQLLDLHPDVAKLVDEGKINLLNGRSLSVLSQEGQLELMDQARTLTNEQLRPIVKERKTAENKDARANKPVGFVATPHARKFSDVKAEFESINGSTPGPAGQNVIAVGRLTTAEEGFTAAIRWFLNMDDASIAAAKKDYDDRQAAAEAKREEAKAGRAKKEAEDLTFKAKRSQRALELHNAGASQEDIKAELEKMEAEYKATKKAAAPAA